MKMISLEEISTIVTGGTPSTEKKEYWDGGNIPWLQSGCCQNCYVDSASAYITKLGYDNSSTRMMPKDTVLIALTGATAGKVGYLTFEACANQSVTGITPKKGYSSKFIYYYLQYLRPKILFDCIGGAQPHISQGYVKKIQIPEIDLESQVKIVEQIDNIKNEISNCEHQLLLFDELVKSRFIEMFGEPVKNPNGYPKKELGEIAFITKLAGFEYTQYIHYKDEGPITMVRGLNCKKGKLVLDDVYYENKETSDLLPRSKLNKGDIVLTYVGTIAECALIDEDNKYHLAPNVAKVSLLNKNVNIPEFFTALFVCFRDYIVNFATATSQPKISMGEIRKIPFIVPPTDKQKEFSDFVKQIDKSKFNVQSNIGKLNELLDKLMNDSFGGSLNA